MLQLRFVGLVHHTARRVWAYDRASRMPVVPGLVRVSCSPRTIPCETRWRCNEGQDTAIRPRRLRAGCDHRPSAAGCRGRHAHPRVQPQDPRQDHDARHGRDPHRGPPLRGWRAHGRDHAEGLRPPRLPARRRGVPELHPRRVARGHAPRQRRDGRDPEQPGRHHGPAARLDPAVPHREHRHRLLQRDPGPSDGRTHGRRGPAGVRSGHGQRRALPLRRRHGRPAPIAARAASASSSRPGTRASCRRTRRTAASASSRALLRT
jgi:hypothetical protein